MWSVTRLSGGVLALVHAAVRGVLRTHVRAHYMAQLVPAAHAVMSVSAVRSPALAELLARPSADSRQHDQAVLLPRTVMHQVPGGSRYGILVCVVFELKSGPFW